MAAFVRTSFVNNYRGLVSDSRQLLIEANGGGSDAARKALQLVLQQPHFIITGTTDTNTAAASSPVLALNNEGGVAFPANSETDVVVRTTAVNGANRIRYTCAYRVAGATDPTLKGVERFLTDCNCSYGFTTADGTTTTEVAAECIGPEWWDGASPVAGNVASNAITIQWLGTNAPVRVLLPRDVQNFDAAAIAADARVYQHGNVSLTNGTSDVFISDVATPTAANWSNASVVRAYARIFPPVQSPLLINTATTPDEVTLGALGLSSDLVTWRFEVFVGNAVDLPLL